MSLYRDAASIKIDQVKLYMDTILERDVKFIIFVHNSTTLEGMTEYLKEKKVKSIKIDRSAPAFNGHKMVEEYQNNDSVRVALLSVATCEAGLMLTNGKPVVFAELCWNPGTLLQAEDRMHGIGQSCSVVIHYLVCRRTVDEYVWPVLPDKLNVKQSLGTCKNNLKNADISKCDSKQTVLDEYINK